MDERNNQNQNVELDASEVKKVRIAKLNDLVERGQNPFEITSYNRTHTAGAIISDYEGHDGLEVAVAGRLMSKRIMGKASFGSILDSDGRIQVYFSRDDLGEAEYADFKKMDMGDIIGVEGIVFKTRTGETSIHAKKFTLLSKSLLPLPEKYQ